MDCEKYNWNQRHEVTEQRKEKATEQKCTFESEIWELLKVLLLIEQHFKHNLLENSLELVHTIYLNKT